MSIATLEHKDDSLARSLRTVAVIGTGLIGTSVALALRKHGVTAYLMDRDPSAAAVAAAMGAGIDRTPDEPVDLAVIAVPPAGIARVLLEAQSRGLARSYMDVASVKCVPLSQADALGCDLRAYVGSHPLAGGERSGPIAASASRFEGRPWVLTPVGCTSAETLEPVESLITICGAYPVVMDSAAHDRIVARTSHVPHLISAVLAATLDRLDSRSLELCGAGVRDATRIAAGSSTLWADILQSNAVEVGKVVAEIIADLVSVSQALRSPVTDDVIELLRRGNRGRSALLADRLAPAPTNLQAAW